MSKKHVKFLSLALIVFAVFLVSSSVFASSDAAAPVLPVEGGSSMPWWAWPLILFVVTFLMGIVAVLGGVGGGVLFVPIIGGFFPFHIDFVRGAGLLVALAGALAAGPGLLKKGMADLRLAIPVAVIASSCAIVGAMIGLALPANIVNIALGGTILGIVAIMLMAKKSEYPDVKQADNLSTALRISGDISRSLHRSGHQLEDPQDPSGTGNVHYYRSYGRHVRTRRRLGKCACPEPDDGRSLKGLSCNKQVSAFDNRHLCCLDICQQRRSTSDDGCPFYHRHNARLNCWGTNPCKDKTSSHSLYCHIHVALCRIKGIA